VVAAPVGPPPDEAAVLAATQVLWTSVAADASLRSAALPLLFEVAKMAGGAVGSASRGPQSHSCTVLHIFYI
jgi:hypothetical protein